VYKLTFAAIIATVLWWIASSPTTEAIVLADGSLDYPGYTFSNTEVYSLEARVLSREDYRMGREADLSPTDLALGWGRMSDPVVAGEFEVSQSNRWYYWRADQLPIPRSEIVANSANVHIVPANESVADTLSQVSTDDHVRLTGMLVDIRADDGWRWTSSRSRSDTGSGSCELMLVEHIEWL